MTTYEITWSITETTTYRMRISPEDVGLPADTDLSDPDVRAQLEEDHLGDFEEGENEIRYDNSEGREITDVVRIEVPHEITERKN